MSDSANCNIYGKLVKWNKKAHQQTHDPERLFSCTQYNKSFFVAKTKDKKKEYSCAPCGKLFVKFSAVT